MSEILTSYKLFDKIVTDYTLADIEQLSPLLEITLLENGVVKVHEIETPVTIGVTQIDQLIEILKLLKRQINELHQPTE